MSLQIHIFLFLFARFAKLVSLDKNIFFMILVIFFSPLFFFLSLRNHIHDCVMCASASVMSYSTYFECLVGVHIRSRYEPFGRRYLFLFFS